MSMNLYVNNKAVDLWQTPTWVTYMVLLDRKGKARKWKDTRHLYLEWVKSHTQGAWKDDEQYIEMKNRVLWHTQDIMKAGKLKFYCM